MVLSLAIAVKELLENALDAGSTIVEVKLRDYGKEKIEVSDNGSGISEANFDGLSKKSILQLSFEWANNLSLFSISAAKYHTSKLREFSDMEEIATFGFRGEALSSLCALSDMTVTTKHRSVNVATQMEFNRRGELTKKISCARQTGTTVTLTDLFGSLPVRKREFHKNIQKEFNKTCEIIQAYGLIAYGKRIFLTNQTAKGGTTTILSTTGSFSMHDNIIAIFGSKQSTSIIEINQPVHKNEVLTQDAIKKLDESISLTDEEIENLGLNRFVFDGFISNCSHGYGRSTRDRQFFFINGRPCDPKPIIKLVNDSYHKFNANQYPFIALNILVDRKNVDVNLTPDKRNLLVNNEAILKLALKKSLFSTFTPLATSFKLQNTSLTSLSKTFFFQKNDCIDDPVPRVNSNETSFGNGIENPTLSLLRKSMNAKQCLLDKVVGKRKLNATDEIDPRGSKLKKMQDYLQRDKHIYSAKSDTDSDHEPQNCSESTSKQKNIYYLECSQNENAVDNNEKQSHDAEQSILEYSLDCKVNERSTGWLKTETFPPSPNSLSDVEQLKQPVCSVKEPDESDQLNQEYNNIAVSISIAEIESLMKNELHLESQFDNTTQTNKMKFKAKIDPAKNKAAEMELDTEILKEDFQRMDIIGQFNLGFIICRLDNDLFIVDQHATDEKYNFETLQKTTRLQHQPLVVPQSLDLSAVNENVLLSHLEMFEMNGFRFNIDIDQPITQRIKLAAKPHSKNWDFGRDVINELIFMIQEDSESSMSIDVCRPSKVRAMFASRACRKSVMIGTSLAKSDMRRLIDHMGLIDQPWVSLSICRFN